MFALENLRLSHREVRRVAVIWQRFGPYHLARLQGAREVLGSKGIEVHGIEVAREDPEYRWAVVENDGRSNRHTLFADRNYGSIAKRELAARMIQILSRIDPQAVAINGWAMPEALTALGWCRARRRIAVLMSETYSEREKTAREVAKSIVVRGFDAALVGGEPHVRYAAELGVPKRKIFKGYDVVDNDHFARGANRARADADAERRRLGLPKDYFFANTRFIPRKNVDVLLRAFARFQRSGGGWGLVISGSGEMESPWKSLTEQLGLQNIHWPGFLQYDALPTYYGLASAFIHPALSEPWGLVLNEAAASGLPILSSVDVGARHELVEDGKNGWLFEPNERETSEVMSRMASTDAVQRATMAAHSAAISARWTPETFGKGLLQAIEAARA